MIWYVLVGSRFFFLGLLSLVVATEDHLPASHASIEIIFIYSVSVSICKFD